MTTSRKSTSISDATGAAVVSPATHTGLGTRRKPRGADRRRIVGVAGIIVAAVLILLATALSGRIGADFDLILPVGVALMVALAYANGSNDVPKAIATLAGSGVTNYRKAIAWGAACMPGHSARRWSPRRSSARSPRDLSPGTSSRRRSSR